MKELFEFVKVASGEPFPFESRIHDFRREPIHDILSAYREFEHGEIMSDTYYFLRPVTPPAADEGREADKLKEIAKFAGNYDRKYSYLVLKNIELFAKGEIKYMDILPAAGEAEPGMREDFQPFNEQWEKEMMRFPKASLVRKLGQAGLRQHKAEDELHALESAPSAPSPVGGTRENAEKWFRTWLQERYKLYQSEQVESALAMYDHLASLSAAQPDAETMKVLDECLQKEYSKTPTRLDESSPAQPGFSEWISVKDRLPEPTLDVVLLIDHFCETKNYYEVTKWDGGQINSWRVTHWMPLPSPPLNKQP